MFWFLKAIKGEICRFFLSNFPLDMLFTIWCICTFAWVWYEVQTGIPFQFLKIEPLLIASLRWIGGRRSRLSYNCLFSLILICFSRQDGLIFYIAQKDGWWKVHIYTFWKVQIWYKKFYSWRVLESTLNCHF